MAMFIAIYGSAMLLCGIAAGIVAYVKRRDVSFWMTTTFLFPPALIMLLLMSRNSGVRPKREGLDAQEHRELRQEDGDRIF